MAMPQDALQHLSDQFQRESIGEGLPIERFIPVVLDVLPDAVQNHPHTLADLKELFAQIDVDGSGQVSWSEFSDFCVQAGFVASEGEMIKTASTQYKQRTTYRDRELRLPNVESMLSFVVADMQLLAVCDARFPKVRVYLIRAPPDSKAGEEEDEEEEEEEKEEEEEEEAATDEDTDNDGNDPDARDDPTDPHTAHSKKSHRRRTAAPILETDEDVLARTSQNLGGNVYFLGEMSGKPPVSYVERKRGDKKIQEGGFLAAVWMPSLNIIACSRSSLSISFWNIHSLHEKPPRFSPQLMSSINTAGPQHCLAWHESSHSLFAAGDRSMKITRYAVSIEQAGQRKLHAVPIANYVAHSGTITQLLILDAPFLKDNHHQLCSAGMDGFIQ